MTWYLWWYIPQQHRTWQLKLLFNSHVRHLLAHFRVVTLISIGWHIILLFLLLLNDDSEEIKVVVIFSTHPHLEGEMSWLMSGQRNHSIFRKRLKIIALIHLKNLWQISVTILRWGLDNCFYISFTPIKSDMSWFLPCDKCTYCKSLSTKASIKCP